MTDAPTWGHPRIWAYRSLVTDRYEWSYWNPDTLREPVTEYVRADIHQSVVDALRASLADLSEVCAIASYNFTDRHEWASRFAVTVREGNEALAKGEHLKHWGCQGCEVVVDMSSKPPWPCSECDTEEWIEVTKNV